MTRTALVAIFVLGAMLVLPQWGSKAGQKPEPAAAKHPGLGSRTIKVTGIGMLQSEPDAAVVEFSVVTSAESVPEARSESATAVAKVEQALEALKIPRMSVTTQGLELDILRAESKPDQTEPPRVIGYQLNHALKVGFQDDDVERLAKHTALIVDTALGTGATALSEVKYFKIDQSTLRRDVLKKAVENATENARVLARTAGADQVEIIEILTDGRSGGGDFWASLAFPPPKHLGQASTSIKPEMESFSEEVTVVFRF